MNGRRKLRCVSVANPQFTTIHKPALHSGQTAAAPDFHLHRRDILFSVCFGSIHPRLFMMFLVCVWRCFYEIWDIHTGMCFAWMLFFFLLQIL